MYIRVSHTLLHRLGNIVSNGRNSEDSVFISFFGNISKSVLVGLTQIIIRTHLILVCLSLQTFSCIPFVTLDSNSENMLLRELFLSKIHPSSEFVFFLI